MMQFICSSSGEKAEPITANSASAAAVRYATHHQFEKDWGLNGESLRVRVKTSPECLTQSKTRYFDVSYATDTKTYKACEASAPATPEYEHESTAMHLAEHLAEKGVNREIAVQLMTRWAIAYAMPDPIPAILSQKVRNVCDRAFDAAQHKREERRLREQQESYNRSSGIGWSND